MRIVLLAAAGIAAAVAVLLLLPHGSDRVPAPGAVPRPPAPAAGALVLAREAGRLAVALAVQGPELTATVLAQDGGPWHGPVVFAAGGRTAAGRECGPGCYRASVAHGRDVSVRVGRSPVAFRLPAAAPSGTALLRRTARVFRGLRSLTLDERISSGAGHVVRTHFVLAAPDRLTYRQATGSQAVVIGRRRWDRVGSGPWERAAQSPISVPTPFWDSRFTNARVIGRAGGVATVAFYTPRLPAWYEARIDERTGRTLEATMVAASHFMHHRYSGFNAPVRIRPPR